MQGNLFSGVIYLLRGIHLVLTPGLKRYILIPIGINLILLGCLFAFIYTHISHYYHLTQAWLPGWIMGILGWVLWLSFSLISILFTSMIFTLLTNFIAAPFYGLLAEKTELKLTGTLDLNPKSIGYYLNLTPNILVRELRKLLYFIPWLLLGAIVFVFPLTFLIAPFVWLLILSWILGIQYLDYSADNQRVSFRQMLKLIKHEPLTVLGFGAAITLLMGIPGLNLVIPAAAVAGGTVFWLELCQKHV